MDEIFEPIEQQHDSAAIARTAKRAYSRSMLNIMLYGVIGEVIVSVLVLILDFANVYEPMSLNLKYLVNFMPMYLIAFPIYLLLSKPLETTPPEKHKMNVGQFLIAIMMCEGIAICGSLIGTAITTFLTLIFGIETSSSLLTDGVFGEGQLIFCIVAVLFAPAIEEFLFRKVLIDRIRKYGDGTAILLSGILFGLFHGNFTQCFYAAGLGMFFAFIYIRTGKIQYTIGMHMVINFIGSVVSGFVLKDIDLEALLNALSDSDISAMIGQIESLIPLFIYEAIIYSIAIAGIVLLIVNRKKFRIAPPMVRLEKGTQAKTAILNIGFWAMIIYCIVLFVMQIVNQMVE